MSWKDHEGLGDAYVECSLDEIEFLASLFGTKSKKKKKVFNCILNVTIGS